MNRNLLIAAALIVALIALGGNFFVLLTEDSQLDQNKTALSSQITVLHDAIGSLQTTVGSLQGQLSQSQQAQNSEAQQISTLQSNLRNVQSQLGSVTAEFNSNRSSDLAFQGQINAQLQGISASLGALTAKLDTLTPDAPLSILAVVNHTYDNVTNTFTFVVQNTQNFTVYAQISAYMLSPDEDCDIIGSYNSQVYTFPPESNVVTQLNLASGLYETTGGGQCLAYPVAGISLHFIAGQSFFVSHGYEFEVVPVYFHP